MSIHYSIDSASFLLRNIGAKMNMANTNMETNSIGISFQVLTWSCITDISPPINTPAKPLNKKCIMIGTHKFWVYI